MKKLTLCICLLLSILTGPALSSALAGPLHDAAFIGDINEVKRLIAEGINVNQKDNDGRTPLHWAALNNHKVVAELLIAHGAKVNVKDKDQRTPLQRAASSGHKDMVQLLKRHGAKGRAAKRGTKKKSKKKKSAKWEEITEEQAKLLFYWPGPDKPRVRRQRSKGSSTTRFTEIGHWRARSSEWPQALLLLQEADSEWQFIEGRALAEVIKKSYPSSNIIMSEREKSANQIGKLELQRFTRNGIECVAMWQYTGYIEEIEPYGEGLGDTMIGGWYCAAPLASLTDETVTRFVQGIGVKGIALPKRPVTRSVGYRVGIFPCEGGFFAGTEWDRVIDSLHATVQREPALMLAYSHYDDAYNEPLIKNPDSLWTASAKPNPGLVYTLGRERQLDAVVMCWMKFEGVPHSAWPGWGDELSLKLYVIDVKQNKVYRRSGTSQDVRKITKKVFAQFLKARP